MPIIESIILGALGNGLYDVVVKGIKRLSQPSRLDKFLSNRRWKRLYEQAGLIDRVERYRAEGSQNALVAVGQALEKALQSEEFASLASDVQGILTSQEELRVIMGTGFSQLSEGQDEIKDMISHISQEPMTIQIGQVNIQMNLGVFAPALADSDREAFVVQVEEIFRITGHEVQRNVIVGGEEIDISAALPMTLGRPRQITYVRCVHAREVTRQEMNNFRRVLADAPRATGMMVSQHGFESSAIELAREHDIVAFNYEQLVSEIIDFSSYLDRLIDDYAQQGVEYGMPLKKLYVEQDIIEDLTRRKYPLSDYVKDWLEDDSQNLLVILGDFGIGKTSYTLKLASELAEKRKLEKAGIIPVRIELKNYRETLSYEKMLVNHLLEHKVNTTSDEAFDFLLRTGEVLLILDAFDEMAVQVNEEVTKKNFDELYRAVKGKAKVILTCRTHYFREHPEVESLIYDIHAPEGFRTPGGTTLYRSISGRKNCKICFLQPFDDGKLDEYLYKALGDEGEAALKMLKENQGLKDLATRPVLLAMIAQSFREISNRGKISSTAELYEAYIQKWIERDDIRVNLTREGKERFAEVLACKLWSENTNRIHYSDLRPMVEQQFKSSIQVPAHAEYAEHEVRTASFLVRDAEGNYGFAHKSFMEFFLARKFVDEIERNQIIDFGREKITEEVTDFLAGMIADENLLYELIRNKTPEEVGYAGANVISVLKTMRDDLNGVDFSNCVLSHADFEVHSLAGADFSGAYMDDIHLSLYGFSRILLSPDEKYIVVGGGGVTILDSSDFSIVKEIETKYSVENVTYSPDEKYIVGAGGVIGGSVTILDSSDFSIVKEIEAKSSVGNVTYSPDEKYIIVGGGNFGVIGGLTILDSSDFSIVKEISTIYPVKNVTYSPDEKYIVGVGGGVVDVGLTLLDSSDFSIVKEIGAKHSVENVAYSPDEKYIVGVGGGVVDVGGVTLLNSSDFSIVKEIETKYPVSDVEYTVAGKHIVLAGSGIGGITILDAESFQIVKEITKVMNDVKGIKIDGAKGLDPVLEEALRRAM